MSRKKKVKNIDVIETIDFQSIVKEKEKPKCFNDKASYCKKELCEEWFDVCQAKNTSILESL
jgi:hypothetical protein